ncbi:MULTISPECIES: ROK family transcriptional regulator [unclassified Streptomyces]|uniref:ROK family transcriptional regulator n=1 Tax=unclassified Streptomyces TaxID=2593676 RepID=UPI002238CC6C|nr:ROK family transcriptional regulator [Streptomyces sp. SHP 1-2]MCW5251808.1 ROK family transcriptional regulator [Streptomyces sp. SHP 1-2]
MTGRTPAATQGSGPWHPDDGPGRILELITSGRARTRSGIARITGLSRSTVGQRLDALFEAGLVREGAASTSARGRPSRALHLNESAGVVIAVDIGESRTRVAVTDLEARVLADAVEPLALSEGPEALLGRITETVHEVVRDAGAGGRPIAGIGFGLPAPVDYEAGHVLGWSIMTGWDTYDIRAHLRADWPVPILIDNDVNLLTLAEHRRFWSDQRNLLYIKAGTGVGSGMVIDGRVHRGSQGAAGDIGHAHVSGFGDPQCRCGNQGCLESLVGGWALARDLGGGRPGEEGDARSVVEHVRRGDSRAIAALRKAGRVLGESAAYATSLLNPDVIVLGGLLGTTGGHLMAGVREVVYQRSLPLATRQLQIVPTRYKSHAGITGAAHLVRDHVLAPATLDSALAAGSSPFPAP